MLTIGGERVLLLLILEVRVGFVDIGGDMVVDHWN